MIGSVQHVMEIGFFSRKTQHYVIFYHYEDQNPHLSFFLMYRILDDCVCVCYFNVEEGWVMRFQFVVYSK